MARIKQERGFGDRYELLEPLGRGGFGQVIKARQKSTGQVVALKTLALDGADPDAAKRHEARLIREVELCAELHHPNIVHLIDSGRNDEGKLYTAFEFIPGNTLADVIADEGPLQPQEACRLLGQVLDALGAAHSMGVVHRDLKPENIMIVATGARRNAMVLDFGIGRVAEPDPADTRLTRSLETLGTPAYSAPEQLRGEAVGPPADLFAWGLIFVECLSGERVFAGGSIQEILHKQFNSRGVELPDWIQDGPLGDLLSRALALDPSRRPTDVGEMLRHVENADHSAISRARASALPGLVTTQTREPTTTSGEQASRRQITVLSCRFALEEDAADIDSSDARMLAHRAVCEEVALDFGGIVGSTLGDRVMLLFGYDTSREDDARRATAAAMRIVERTLPRKSVQIGVHTGLVIARGLDRLAGSTPEIALALSSAAAAGEILISDDTASVVLRAFRLDPRGELQAAQVSRSLPVFRVLGGADSEFGAAGPSTPFVGRKVELATLRALWEQAEAGRPAAALVTGEAGIGKSRLVYELGAVTGSALRIDCRCTPETRSTPLAPVLEMTRQIVGDQSVEAIANRLGADPKTAVPLLHPLIGRESDPRFPDLEEPPQRRLDLTLETLAGLVFRLAQVQPVLLVVEDLHWIDPTSQRFLELLNGEIETARVLSTGDPSRLLAIYTARLEDMPRWDLSEVTPLSLARLSPSEVGEMVSTFAPDVVAGGRVRDVVARADGVPLFVEEITRMMTSGREVQASGEAAVPSSLRDLLAARLDQLEPLAKETAQLAATLGREFDLDLLRRASGLSRGEVDGAVERLLEAGLLRRRHRVGAQEQLLFNHALVRDTAYASVLRSDRPLMHERVAGTLLAHFPEIRERTPEVLAHHLTVAGSAPEAIEVWKEAGDLASRRWANLEASEHFGRAIELLRALPEDEARDARELELTAMLGTALIAAKGYGAEDVRTAFDRASALCRRLGDTPLPVVYGVWAVHLQRSDREATNQLADWLREFVGNSDDPVALNIAHSCLGTRAFLAGELEDSLAHLDTAIQLFDEPRHAQVSRDYGGCGGLYGHLYKSWCLWFLGRQDEAREHAASVHTLASELDPYSLATALIFEIAIGHDAGDPAAVETAADHAIRISTEQDFPFWLAIASCGKGWARSMSGDPETGIETVREGLSIFRNTGCRSPYTYYVAYLYESLVHAGRFDEAEKTLLDALDMAEGRLDQFYVPELLRLKAEVSMRRGDRQAARSALEAGLELARTQGAKTHELRICTTLAELDPSGSGDGLRQALAGFDENSVGRDVARARGRVRALLDRIP